MPLPIFNSLSLRPLHPTGVVIQLENRSVAHPTGLIEDVLVRVGELIFPADFYIFWYGRRIFPWFNSNYFWYIGHS